MRPGTSCGPRAGPNTLGAIVDSITDQVLLSKQPVQFPDAPFQPHWQTIERGDQVQVSLYSQSIPPFTSSSGSKTRSVVLATRTTFSGATT